MDMRRCRITCPESLSLLLACDCLDCVVALSSADKVSPDFVLEKITDLKFRTELAVVNLVLERLRPETVVVRFRPVNDVEKEGVGTVVDPLLCGN